MKRSGSIISKLSIAILAVFLLAMASPPADAGGVLSLLKAKEKIVRQVLAAKTTPGTPEHLAKETKLRTTINELFDFEELGKRALELYWDDLDPAKRKQFVELLQQLIEKNYLLKITKSTTYQLAWGKEVQEEEWTVVGIKVKSGKYQATIHFRLIQKADRWVIFDMLIDDVSLMENYRSQFNRIIRKDGFDKLLEKMRSRLDEMEKGGDGGGDLDAPEKPAAPAAAAQ